MTRRVKGPGRQIARGTQGLSENALKKTLQKMNRKASNQGEKAGTRSPRQRARVESVSMTARVYRVIASKALSGVGLTDKALRMRIHRLVQKIASQRVRYDFSNNYKTRENAIRKITFAQIIIRKEITRSSGAEAANKFFALIEKHKGAIEDILEEDVERTARMN